MSVAFLLTLLAAAAGPASRDDGVQPPEEKQICERQIETGSRLRGKRICKTKREWNEDAAEARRAMRDGLTSGLQGNR